MKKGDIVLIPFPFTNLSGSKKRPATVLIDSEDDVTICFITTQLKWQSNFDVVIPPSKTNGLKKTSLIRLNKIATIDKSLIIGILGNLEQKYLKLLDENLVNILKLYNNISTIITSKD
ncbi:type II toxin-antitoxin system PemK/MazF family toxin [Flavobacteriaceae bacterium 14752]|uniref:type II toxin-antitoxin system PemK/MazF family toxin n=1 Tax=Mesohalobacter salilacus TaxID=2491711 RepID=UPI000F638C88|nr:type II toxin-antitoxin system PemK/MazF family toxin [Flavobacteriaceae bacterium 14752]